MNCPLYKDYTRECLGETEVHPTNITKIILDFCSSNKHKECPFYKMLIVKENICKHIQKCPAFAKFQDGAFHAFVETSNKYCTSENHAECERYKLKEKGNEVPTWLHPDGKHIKE